MTLLVAAVIVHDKAIDVDAIPEEFVDTAANALHHYLDGGPKVSLDGWRR
jgi:hypothetical protein